MNTFFRELFRGGLYKRTQGRVTRQVTFAAVAVVIVFGLYRLSQTLVASDPVVPKRPAELTYAGNAGKVSHDATVQLTGVAPKPAQLTYAGNAGKAVDNATIQVAGNDRSALIRITKDNSLEEIARKINGHTEDTDVIASVSEDGNTLTLSSLRLGSRARVKVEVQAGTFDVQGGDGNGSATGTDLGSATVTLSQGDTLAQVARAFNERRKTTGVKASVSEDEDTLTLTSVRSGAGATIQVDVLAGTFHVDGADPDGTARGSDPVDLGLRYCIPGVLLLAGLWSTYRLVNVPGFADFLIAVEAEMNKVSWPTRSELRRGAIVVLVTIFALATILVGFDIFWERFFTWLGIL